MPATIEEGYGRVVTEERTIVRGDAQLFCKRMFLESGASERVPMLMLHGGLVDCDFFDGCATALARLFDVVTFDRRGYGRSSDAPSGDYSLSSQADDAAAVIEAYFDEPCMVVTHSVGAAIGMTLVAEHPQLVLRALYYEPPVPACLPQDSKLVRAVAKTRVRTHEGRRIGTIGDGFLFGMAPKDDRAYTPSAAERERSARNTKCSISNEGDVLMLFEPDFDALSRVPSVLGLGEMDRTAPIGTMVEAIAQQSGMPIAHFPGGHNCPADLPNDFAWMTAGILLMPCS